MTTLSKEASKLISEIIDSMREDSAELDDIESLADLLKGEFDENHPNLKVSRSSIRDYLLKII